MAPSGVCVALAFTALMGMCVGEVNEASAALIDTLASDKSVRQHTHEGATLYIRELSKGASDGPTPSLKNPCNVSYMVRISSPRHLPRAFWCCILVAQAVFRATYHTCHNQTAHAIALFRCSQRFFSTGKAARWHHV